jgi:hypothetical protein
MRLLLAIAVLGLLWPKEGLSHSWYEAGCCSDRDCEAVEDVAVKEKPDGIHVAGFGVLSHTDPRLRWGRDDRWHLCISKPSPPEAGKLLCVYRPARGT